MVRIETWMCFSECYLFLKLSFYLKNVFCQYRGTKNNITTYVCFNFYYYSSKFLLVLQNILLWNFNINFYISVSYWSVIMNIFINVGKRVGVLITYNS